MIGNYIQRLGQRNPGCLFEQLDPRCKLIILFVVTMMIIVGDSLISAGLFVAVGIAACIARLFKLYVFTGIFFALLWIIIILITQHVLKKPLEDPREMFFGMVFRGTTLIVAGFWFSVTTKLRDITAALEAWRVPVVIILPLTIAVRFIPTLLNESLVIRDSMRLRRISHRRFDFLKKPHLIGQSYLALIIIRSLKMADELAAVAETRGLARPVNHNSFRTVRFKRNDYLTLIILTFLAVFLAVMSFSI